MKRFGLGLGLVMGVAVAAQLALAAGAWAATILVNTNADTVADTGTCTLKEAITAANTNTISGATMGECAAGDPTATAIDTINFQSPPFTGQIGMGGMAQINTTGPPDITEEVDIVGPPPCGILFKPCVGVNISPALSNDGFKITGNKAVTITGISLTNATTAIDAANGTLTSDHLWIGLTLNQSVVGPNTVGVRLNSNSSVGDGDTDRNVFTANGIGVYVNGGDDNTIQGTDFGQKPDGSGTSPTGFANGTNIRIVDDATGMNPATGNLVGGQETDDPQFCEGPCNLLSFATGAGLDLNGTGGAEGAATGPTTVKGNFVGLAFNGEMLAGNGTNGIVVGDADDVTVGGTSTDDRNVIADNGAAGISETSGASDTVIQNNFLGLNAAGNTLKPDTNREISSAGGSADVLDNRIGGASVLLAGDNADFQGNVIGVGTGGEDVGTPDASVVIDGDGAEVGGTGAGEANVISNSAEDAIQVTSATADNDVFQANTGRDNGALATDQFIDLGTAGQGNASLTNGGIEAPVVTSATATQIQGTSPEAAGTLIDVYRTITERGDVRSYLGQTSVDGSGNWSFTYGAALGDGDCVTATQTETDTPKGTSELAPTTTVGGGPCAVIAPTASIVSGPTGPTNDSTPTFGLSASDLGSTFECSLDGAAFTPCADPYTTSPLGDGTHTLQIQATDPDGNTGAPSAIRSFVIDSVAPTTIVNRIVRHRRKGRAKLIFTADDPAATFTCRLDDGALKPCASPRTYRHLSPGRHTFEVRALDPAGNVDASPVLKKMKVLGPGQP